MCRGAGRSSISVSGHRQKMVLSGPAHARSITCPCVRDKATYVLAPATSAPPCFCSAKARANSMPSARFFFSHKEYGAGKVAVEWWRSNALPRACPAARPSSAS